MASNRGHATIRGTNYKSPHGLPLDFLDRVVIISTNPYKGDEIREILSIRATEEEVDISPDALALLTKIGQETGLRYASNLITTSHLISQKRKAKEIEVSDVQRSFSLFYDPLRSARFVAEFEKRFIGEDGGVSLTTNGVNDGDAMEVS
jgi:RuvB-like protein 2